MKYFLDADVVLDVVLFRREFGDSIELVSKFEKYGDQMMTSPLVLAIVFYLVEKNRNRSDAKKSVKKMRRMMEVVPLNQGMVDRALLKGVNDFEDALEYFAAEASDVDYLITRNIVDFSFKGKVKVLTPTQILKMIAN